MNKILGNARGKSVALFQIAGLNTAAKPAHALLRAAVAVALRCGRPEDAVVAAGMLPDGSDKLQLLLVAGIAEALQRAW